MKKEVTVVEVKTHYIKIDTHDGNLKLTLEDFKNREFDLTKKGIREETVVAYDKSFVANQIIPFIDLNDVMSIMDSFKDNMRTIRDHICFHLQVLGGYWIMHSFIRQLENTNNYKEMFKFLDENVVLNLDTKERDYYEYIDTHEDSLQRPKK